MKKTFVIILILASVLLLVAACGGSKPAEPTAAPTAAPTEAPAEPTMAPTEAPTAEPTSAPAEEATAPAQEEALGDPAKGEQAFVDLGCSACHTDEDTPVAPTLHGIYGKPVILEGGGKIAVANDDYLRESIVNPGVKLVKGYGPLMPSTFTALDEDTLNDLIAYIRSLGD